MLRGLNESLSQIFAWMGEGGGGGGLLCFLSKKTLRITNVTRN